MRFAGILPLATWMVISAGRAQTDPATLQKSRHEHEDQQWARKTGLTPGEVRSIRLLAGMTDDSSGWIAALDAVSLRARAQVLFTEIGNGHCFRAHVLVRRPEGFSEVWSLDREPRPPWTSGGSRSRSASNLCPQAPGKGPAVHVEGGDRIVLEVPVLADPFLQTVPVSRYVFVWNGKTYELQDE